MLSVVAVLLCHLALLMLLWRAAQLMSPSADNRGVAAGDGVGAGREIEAVDGASALVRARGDVAQRSEKSPEKTNSGRIKVRILPSKKEN